MGCAPAGSPEEGRVLFPVSSHAAAKTRRAAHSLKSQPRGGRAFWRPPTGPRDATSELLAPASHPHSGQFGARAAVAKPLGRATSKRRCGGGRTSIRSSQRAGVGKVRRWPNPRSMRRSGLGCAFSSPSSGLSFPRSSKVGLLTISPLTSCCENAISLPALASFFLAPSNGFADRRRARLAESKDFAWLVTRIRSGPPIGFFRIGWVRSVPNLNEFFVHHEDLRRANGLGPVPWRPRWMPPCGETSVEAAGI
jgi:hypothetical protein